MTQHNLIILRFCWVCQPNLLAEGAALWFAPAIAAGARFALTGFTRHGLNQAISRGGVGVSNRAILNTMSNPTKITYQSGGRVRFTGSQGGVVLNN